MTSATTGFRRLALAIALIVSAAPLSADTYPRQPGIDIEHYTFRLDLRDDRPDIAGEATIRVRFVQPNVHAVALDLTSVIDGKGMTVGSVTTASGPIAYTHTGNRLVIALPDAPPSGERHEFTVRYQGVPSDGLRLIKNKYGEWCAFSENWPNHARDWLPMIDHPYDKATSEFVVAAPSTYQVVSNGLLQQEVDLGDGRRMTHWKQSVPIASWLNAVGVQQFAVHYAGRVRGIELSSWVAHQDQAIGPLYFEEPARRAIEFFSDFVGPYPYEKLANVAAAGMSGGTEHASAIFYGETGVRDTPGTTLVAHEVAHQWFGDAVTERDWDDVWLSEGFATYFTHLYVEHYSGRDAMAAGLRRDITTVLNAERSSPDTPVVHRNLSDMQRVLNRFVYQKGGWVLHMLRSRIGLEAFREGIRAYYREFMNVNASTSDLRHHMELVSGQDLGWFFTQWLTRPGVPKLEGTWRYDPAAKQIAVTLTQTIGGDPFRLPIEIGVVGERGALPRVTKVEMTAATATFTLPSDTAPADVVLDPNTWLLFERGTFTRATAPVR